jgi:hypothetical protein
MGAMFGFRSKLPVTDEEREWVDEGFSRLTTLLGRDRMESAVVALPTDEYFPDPWDATETALELLFVRVCAYMKVDRAKIKLTVNPDYSELMEMLPSYSSQGDHGPAGLLFGKGNTERSFIAVRQSLLKDTLSLVATLAHELGHVILLDGGLLRPDEEDMEPMTDLLTVYLGMGVFNANASRNFRKFQEDRREGWSMSRLGYLPETVFGYALARFAHERGEHQPAWANYLSTNLNAWFRRSSSWLEQESSGG